VTARRGRRWKQLLDDLKEKRGYWRLKEEALDRTGRRTRFGRGYRPVVKQTKSDDYDDDNDVRLLPHSFQLITYYQHRLLFSGIQPALINSIV
jgi:hypothetical protein